jgi:hypothetical protein
MAGSQEGGKAGKRESGKAGKQESGKAGKAKKQELGKAKEVLAYVSAKSAKISSSPHVEKEPCKKIRSFTFSEGQD